MKDGELDERNGLDESHSDTPAQVRPPDARPPGRRVVKLLAIGTWDPDDADIPRLLKAEQQQTGELMKQGFVQELLLRADGAGGYMVLSAESAASAHQQLSTLPFMKDGIMEIELIELND
jgi:muconolactone delta-isomerase